MIRASSTFSSRDDDVIIVAGYRIGPFEVESDIATHPAVIETAVIAVPDEVRGEALEAYVVLKQGHPASGELGGEVQQIDLKTDASLEACAVRKLEEKAGIAPPYIEQLQSWGGPADRYGQHDGVPRAAG